MRGLASRLARNVVIGGVVAAMVLTVVGCTSGGGGTFQLTFPGEHETLTIAPLPVSLVDNSGLVAGFRQAPASPNWVPGVAAIPEGQTALVITWIGGACDRHVSMTSEGTSSALRVAIQTSKAGGCRLVGIGRSVELVLNRAVRAEDVTLSERRNA